MFGGPVGAASSSAPLPSTPPVASLDAGDGAVNADSSFSPFSPLFFDAPFFRVGDLGVVEALGAPVSCGPAAAGESVEAPPFSPFFLLFLLFRCDDGGDSSGTSSGAAAG